MADRINPLGRKESDEPIDVLASRPSRAKRKRSSNKHTITFRVPNREVKEALWGRVKEHAKRIGVPHGELARYLIEYGLDALGSGELDLDPKPQIGRYSLYDDKDHRITG